jgi:putative protease
VVPELLAPAGSLDAVRAAVANGADSIYLGAERFNARDEGAQLTLDELGQACRLAHEHGVRIYLTLNTLVKPGELGDCLTHLGDCIDRGIDAVIVQDLGVVGLIQSVYPGFEIHGSTQMTVHDVSGAAFMLGLGVKRVVIARENTLDDIRAIREGVPSLGLETFIHGALCIAYSGQCFMSGMISERSANRGSCAQSCRKDYVLTDVSSATELDRGYLISARDLAAHEHLPAISDLGIVSLKVEGRKKKPEYVATVTHTYRDLLDRMRNGDRSPLPEERANDLVQIFSRGFTGGMFGGRAGRNYVTRSHPDNRGVELGQVLGWERGELLVATRREVHAGDGLGFEPSADGAQEPSRGFTVDNVRTLSTSGGVFRQALRTNERIPDGWRVVRSFDSTLSANARASFSAVALPVSKGRARVDVRLFGAAGGPLKAAFASSTASIVVESDVTLAPAARHPLAEAKIREQFERMGGTDFVLGSIDCSGIGENLFLPVSELNHMRQRATEQLGERHRWSSDEARERRAARIDEAVGSVVSLTPRARPSAWTLSASVYSVDDAVAAADAGATEVVFDPFLRHPAPSRTRIRSLASDLSERGVTLRLRTPSIIRPDDRRAVEPWLALDLPVLSGHAGLAVELAAKGRDVVADYGVNAFNQHTAAQFFQRGVARIVASVELTRNEILELTRAWGGNGFDVVVFGRPEGMTIDHCVLSAAFDRVVTTCRDLCVQKHTNVQLTDPAGYTFPVATDSACRNRLLHSRPIEASEYVPSLWSAGIRGFNLIFNVPGDPVAEIVAAYRALIGALEENRAASWTPIRELVGSEFTRGHFARAV